MIFDAGSVKLRCAFGLGTTLALAWVTDTFGNRVVALTGLPALCSSIGLGTFTGLVFQRLFGFPKFDQPRFATGQFLGQLIAAFGFAVFGVLALVDRLSVGQQVRDFLGEDLLLLRHARKAHCFAPGRVRPDLRPVQGGPAKRLEAHLKARS